MPESDAMFYFDLANPLAYLVAERIGGRLPGAEWEPVLARELKGPASEDGQCGLTQRDGQRDGEPAGDGRHGDGESADRPRGTGLAPIEPDAARIERLAEDLGLLTVRWPSDFPSDSGQAMLVATYAKSVGRTVAFAQAAFRQAFAAGKSLAEADNLVIAAAACELHPKAVLKGAALGSIKKQLSDATRAAAAAGVTEVPAIKIGGRLLAGERTLQFVTEDTAVPA
jgi:2-hydroxychromene-2-carboxylate isomerase